MLFSCTQKMECNMIKCNDRAIIHEHPFLTYSSVITFDDQINNRAIHLSVNKYIVSCNSICLFIIGICNIFGNCTFLQQYFDHSIFSLEINDYIIMQSNHIQL